MNSEFSVGTDMAFYANGTIKVVDFQQGSSSLAFAPVQIGSWSQEFSVPSAGAQYLAFYNPATQTLTSLSLASGSTSAFVVGPWTQAYSVGNTLDFFNPANGMLTVATLSGAASTNPPQFPIGKNWNQEYTLGSGASSVLAFYNLDGTIVDVNPLATPPATPATLPLYSVGTNWTQEITVGSDLAFYSNVNGGTLTVFNGASTAIATYWNIGPWSQNYPISASNALAFYNPQNGILTAANLGPLSSATGSITGITTTYNVGPWTDEFPFTSGSALAFYDGQSGMLQVADIASLSSSAPSGTLAATVPFNVGPWNEEYTVNIPAVAATNQPAQEILAFYNAATGVLTAADLAATQPPVTYPVGPFSQEFTVGADLAFYSNSNGGTLTAANLASTSLASPAPPGGTLAASTSGFVTTFTVGQWSDEFTVAASTPATNALAFYNGGGMLTVANLTSLSTTANMIGTTSSFDIGPWSQEYTAGSFLAFYNSTGGNATVTAVNLALLDTPLAETEVFPLAAPATNEFTFAPSATSPYDVLAFYGPAEGGTLTEVHLSSAPPATLISYMAGSFSEDWTGTSVPSASGGSGGGSSTGGGGSGASGAGGGGGGSTGSTPANNILTLYNAGSIIVFDMAAGDAPSTPLIVGTAPAATSGSNTVAQSLQSTETNLSNSPSVIPALSASSLKQDVHNLRAALGSVISRANLYASSLDAAIVQMGHRKQSASTLEADLRDLNALKAAATFSSNIPITSVFRALSRSKLNSGIASANSPMAAGLNELLAAISGHQSTLAAAAAAFQQEDNAAENATNPHAAAVRNTLEASIAAVARLANQIAG